MNGTMHCFGSLRQHGSVSTAPDKGSELLTWVASHSSQLFLFQVMDDRKVGPFALYRLCLFDNPMDVFV
jgi:hypothetical protein